MICSTVTPGQSVWTTGNIYRTQDIPSCMVASRGERGVVQSQDGNWGRVTVKLDSGTIIRVMPLALEDGR